ncbi:MAG: acetolactate decarboxylase [Lachnospiraceae bacterium]|nr:acetolactate decarboxylase [Lachnospiraceae bacterium]
MNQKNGKYFQVSTLQALALGYSKSVITVEELLTHGDIGLGTFEDVDGEMIVLDGSCYRVKNNGEAVPAEKERGVPFAAVCHFRSKRQEKLEKMDTVEKVKEWLTLRDGICTFFRRIKGAAGMSLMSASRRGMPLFASLRA